MAQRLPISGQDEGSWGDILNGFLGVSHDANGNLLTVAVTNALPVPIPISKLGSGTPSTSNFLRGDNTWAVPTSTGAQALTATAVKTTAYAAAVGDLIPADATAGTFAVTLPTAPADKTRIAVKKIDATANAVTVAVGGSDVFNKAGGSTSLTLTLPNQAVNLQYATSGGIWYVVGDDLPLSQLDLRYPLNTATPGGDLAGTYAAPTVAKVNGVIISGTPTASQVLTASSATAAAWATPTANSAVGDWVQPSAGVNNALSRGSRSAAINIVSDSTSVGYNNGTGQNNGDGWAVDMGRQLGVKYPAYSVVYRGLNQTSYTLDGPARGSGNNYGYLSNGTGNSGGIRGVNLQGGVLGFDPGTSALTTDFEIVLKVALDNWTTGSAQTVIAAYDTTGNDRSWFLQINAAAQPSLTISSDGTTATAYLCTTAITAATVAATNGAPIWLRAVHTTNTGTTQTCTFYTSTDPVANGWTVCGAPVNHTQTGIYSSTNAMVLDWSGSGVSVTSTGREILLNGRRSGGAFIEPANGKYYWTEVRRNLNTRTDTVVVTSGSKVVTDTSITNADYGRPVSGTGIPASSFVGTVFAGSKFWLSSVSGSQVDVLGTTSGTSAVMAATTAGESIVPPLLDDWDALTADSGVSFIGAPVLMINNFCASGQQLDYFKSHATKLLPQTAPNLVMISTGHNESYVTRGAFATSYEQWITMVKAAHPNVPIIMLAQNPIVVGNPSGGTGQNFTQADQDRRFARHEEIATLAAGTANCYFVDASKAFNMADINNEVGTGTAGTYDNLHPKRVFTPYPATTLATDLNSGTRRWASYLMTQLFP